MAPRAVARDLFLRILGLVFLVAFLSLFVQLDVLVGRNGLLPVGEYLKPPRTFLTAPTIFWLDHRDGTLHAAAIVGALVSLGLVLNVAPRASLVVLWVLYLSFGTIGQDFLSFQWDNLLLESALFALFVAPSGLRPRRAPPPSRLGVFLMLWLVFRLNVESGLAKRLLGDPTWRNLTAMVSYYETAPIPTWIGWWAHQMPLWAHRATAVFVYVAELGLPLLIWGPPTARLVAFAGMEAMQVGVLLTANYGFFNYLSAALLLFVLDDRQLGRPTTETPRARRNDPAVAAVLVALTLVAFVPLVPGMRAADRALLPVHRVLTPFRSINAYHLFAHMTLIRREPVIEGSADGVVWLPYELRYEPGDPDRPPPFVAPHQPRVDFQAWFLLLGPGGARWFDRLLTRLFEAPTTVAGLFAQDPFPRIPPRFVRVAVYRYRFTDRATRRATGAWWDRRLEGYTRPRSASRD